MNDKIDNKIEMKRIIPVAYKAVITPAVDSCPYCGSDKLYKLELIEIYDKSNDEDRASYYNTIRLIEIARELLNEKGLSDFETDDDNLAIKMTFITTIQFIANIIVSEFIPFSNIGKMTVSDLMGITSMANIANIKSEKELDIISLDPYNDKDIFSYAKSQGDISIEAARKMLEIHQGAIKQVSNNKEKNV